MAPDPLKRVMALGILGTSNARCLGRVNNCVEKQKAICYSLLAPPTTAPVSVLGKVVDPTAERSAIEPPTRRMRAMVVPASNTKGLRRSIVSCERDLC